MKTSASFTALIAVFAMTSLAHAAAKTISSPAIFGGSGNIAAGCGVHNIGKNATTVDLVVFDESGNALTPDAQRCNGVSQPVGSTCEIAPGAMYLIFVPITPGAAYACSASGKTVKDLRGATIQEASPGLRRAELR